MFAPEEENNPALTNMYLAIGVTLETTGGGKKPGINLWQKEDVKQDIISGNGRQGLAFKDLPIASEVELLQDDNVRILDLPSGLTGKGLELVNERLEQKGKERCGLGKNKAFKVTSHLNSPALVIRNGQENELDGDLEEALIYVLGLWFARPTERENTTFVSMVEETKRVNQTNQVHLPAPTVVHRGPASLADTISAIPRDRPLTKAQELANRRSIIDWVGPFVGDAHVTSVMSAYMNQVADNPLADTQSRQTEEEYFLFQPSPNDMIYRHNDSSPMSIYSPAAFLGKELRFIRSTYIHVSTKVSREKDKRKYVTEADLAKLALKILIRENGEVIVGSIDETGKEVDGAIVLRGESQLKRLDVAIWQYCKKAHVLDMDKAIDGPIPRHKGAINLLRLFSEIDSRAKRFDVRESVDILRIKWLVAALTWPGVWNDDMRRAIGAKLGLEGLKSENEIIQCIANEITPVVWYLGGVGLDQIKCSQGEWWKMFAGDVSPTRHRVYNRKTSLGIALNYKDWQATLPGRRNSPLLPNGE